MLEKKLEILANHTKKAFNDVISEIISEEISTCKVGEKYRSISHEKVAIVIGITGCIKGRMLLQCDLDTAGKVAVCMNNGELLSDSDELYLYIAEFGNMVCGRAITYLNNELMEQDLWLSPPAIFSGNDIEISTPGIVSKTTFYVGKSGNFLIDIGVEGIN